MVEWQTLLEELLSQSGDTSKPERPRISFFGIIFVMF